MAAMCGSHYVLTVVVQSCYLDRVICSFNSVEMVSLSGLSILGMMSA